VLLLPSLVYGLIIVLRNLAFDLHILKATRAGVPVISVGNLTTGGTGKTPLVEVIVRKLRKRGMRVAVVSRGYGRASEGVVVVADGTSILVNAQQGGDEPVQIARKHPGTVVVVAERRVEAATVAVRDLKAEAIVMDDGFQHRYLHRDVDIVAIDGRTNIVSEWLLPAGRKREPLRSLRRANAVVFTRTNAENSRSRMQEGLSPWFKGAVGFCRHQLDRVHDSVTGKDMVLEKVRLEPLMAFSGIASHEGYIAMLRKLGLHIVADAGFPDHHAYGVADVHTILRAANDAGARALITTEKDFSRLGGSPDMHRRLVEEMPLWYATVSAQFLQGQEDFDRLIERAVGGVAA